MYKKSKDINIIFDQFQQWMDNVLRKECGRQDYRTFHYSLEEFSGFVPYFLGQDIGVGVGSLPTEKGGDVTMPYVPFPIQQIRQEIEAFVEVLLSQDVRSVLEIGLGQFGGTHMLFSQFADSVTTIDIDISIIEKFLKNCSDRKFTELTQGNRIIHGSSHVVTRDNLPHEKFDALFIDGDHRYDAVCDDWNRFSPLVKSKGVIGFHDTRPWSGDEGAARFVNERIRPQFNVRDIWFPEAHAAGISYYIVNDLSGE